MSTPCEPDYFERLKAQKQAAFKVKDDRVTKIFKDRLTKLKTARPLPRYLNRALESADLGRIEACIDKAMGEGWTEEEIHLALDIMKAHVKNIVG